MTTEGAAVGLNRWWSDRGARAIGRRAAAEHRSVGSGKATGLEIIILAVLVVALLAAVLGALLAFWPPTSNAAETAPPPTMSVVYLWWNWPNVTRDGSLFVVAVAAGAIGGLLHTMRSLYWYVGNRNLKRSWILMYSFLPITGAAVSLITYLLLRGGLTTTQASDAINPYGIAATGALAGLFSREAADKLRIVFETLLTPAEKGKDQSSAFQIISFHPTVAKPGDVVTITGRGLGDVTYVQFIGADRVTPTVISDDELRVTVPQGANPGPITIHNPAGGTVSGETITITQ